MVEHADQRFCQALHGLLAIEGIVVFQTDDRQSVLLSNDDVEFLLRHIQIHRHCLYLLAIDGIFLDDPHLIAVGGIGGEVEVGGNAGKGILLVAHGLLEILTRAANEFLYSLFGNVSRKWQGIDKHPCRVGQAQVSAPVADGGDIDMTTVGVA